MSSVSINNIVLMGRLTADPERGAARTTTQ